MAYPYNISPTDAEATVDVYNGSKVFTFSRGADLYVFLRYPRWDNAPQHRPPNNKPLHAFKSADLGVTWAIVDAGNEPQIMMTQDPISLLGMQPYQPSSSQGVMKAGSTDIVLIPYVWDDGTFDADYGTLSFVEFDMSTDTWGVPVTTGPRVIATDISDYLMMHVVGQYSPTDGKYVFIYNYKLSAAQWPPPRNYYSTSSAYVTYDGLAWSAPVEMGDALVDVYNTYPRDVVYDPVSTRLHFFTITSDWGDIAIQCQKLYHQTWTAGPGMSVPQLVPTGAGVYGIANAGLGAYGTAVAGLVTNRAIITSSGHIAFSYVKDRAVPNQLFDPWPQSMVLAQVAAVPVWTEYPVTANPADQVTTGPVSIQGFSLVDVGGGVIRGSWTNPQSVNGFLIQTADFDTAALSWGAVSTLYTHTDDDFSDWWCAAAGVVPGTMNVIGSNKTGAAPFPFWPQNTMSFWQFVGGGPPPPPAAPAIAPPGWGVYPPRVPIPNYYDRCLCRFKTILDKKGIRAGKLCWEFHEHPNEYRVPKDAVEFYQQGKVDFAAPDANDNLVVEFKVPTGYDGQLYGLTLGIVATGFEDGSGDVIWRVKVGNAWARNMGNVQWQLGQVYQCLQLSDHIQVLSDQTVQILAAVPNTTGGIDFLDPVRVICAAQGWYYPNR